MSALPGMTLDRLVMHRGWARGLLYGNTALRDILRGKADRIAEATAVAADSPTLFVEARDDDRQGRDRAAVIARDAVPARNRELPAVLNTAIDAARGA